MRRLAAVPQSRVDQSSRLWMDQLRATVDKAAGPHDNGLVVTVQGKALAQRDGSGNHICCDWIFFHGPPEVQQRAEEQLAPGQAKQAGDRAAGSFRGEVAGKA